EGVLTWRFTLGSSLLPGGIATFEPAGQPGRQLMFFPGIVEQGAGTYDAATGQTQDPFLTRWLLITAVLFGVSGLVYAVRLATSGRAHPGTSPGSGAQR